MGESTTFAMRFQIFAWPVMHSRRKARVRSATASRRSVRTASRSFSGIQKISAARWSSSSRHRTNEHKHAHCHLFSDLVGEAVRHSTLGRAEPGGKRRCHSRERSRCTGNAPCLAKARLDDRGRNGHFRSSVYALFAQSYSLRLPDDDFRPAASLSRWVVEKKSRARSPAREIVWSFPRSLIVAGVAAVDAPRTSFPPKTWTAGEAGLAAGFLSYGWRVR